MKTTKEPQPFDYLGKTFTPIITQGKYDWNELARNVWGHSDQDHESNKKLKHINEKFTHEDFYKTAKKSGCGKVDIFYMDGEVVIPCNVLRWYKEPGWSKESKKEANYTAQKNKIMKTTCENFILELRGKLEALQYKYVNNTRIFDNEQEYLDFCRAQIRATTLKMIAFQEELFNS